MHSKTTVSVAPGRSAQLSLSIQKSSPNSSRDWGMGFPLSNTTGEVQLQLPLYLLLPRSQLVTQGEEYAHLNPHSFLSVRYYDTTITTRKGSPQFCSCAPATFP